MHVRYAGTNDDVTTRHNCTLIDRASVVTKKKKNLVCGHEQLSESGHCCDRTAAGDCNHHIPDV